MSAHIIVLVVAALAYFEAITFKSAIAIIFWGLSIGVGLYLVIPLVVLAIAVATGATIERKKK